MRLESRKNTKKNFASGFICRIVFLIFQFITRTVIIHQLGGEYSGLDSLFTSILQVLNLTELGVGNALVFSMYKPIAHDDYRTLCALMQIYKTLYRIIGFIILAMGLLIIPFVPQLISGGVPETINVYVIYCLNLSTTAVSYWLFSYRNSLLIAYQRSSVGNAVALGIELLKFVAQLCILFSLKSYYLYLTVTLFTTILNNIVTAWITKKLYPDINPVGNLPKQKRRTIFIQIKDIFTAKLGGVITNSCDTIVVSAFLGLAELTKYSNYYYIVSLIRGFMALIYQSTRAGIGNKLVLDNPEKKYRDFLSFSYICNFVIAVCTSAFLCGIQPFMLLWVKNQWMYPDSVAILFAIYLYIHESASVLITYKDAAGIWHNDRFRPLIVSVINLLMNIVMVRYIGIYGIVLSTILSFMFVGIPWLLSNTFRFIFNRPCKEYVLLTLRNTLLTTISCITAIKLCSLLTFTGIFSFLIPVIIATITTLLLFGLGTLKSKDASEAFRIVTGMMKGSKNEKH